MQRLKDNLSLLEESCRLKALSILFINNNSLITWHHYPHSMYYTACCSTDNSEKIIKLSRNKKSLIWKVFVCLILFKIYGENFSAVLEGSAFETFFVYHYIVDFSNKIYFSQYYKIFEKLRTEFVFNTVIVICMCTTLAKHICYTCYLQMQWLLWLESWHKFSFFNS